jgi:hypothetical protein
MSNCGTCLYRAECDGTCTGYVMDAETREAKDAYYELVADIERDEQSTEL